MRKVGLLGCGKIGKALINELKIRQDAQILFVQAPHYVSEEGADYLVSRTARPDLYGQTDLIIECATASALEDNLDLILKNCDLLVFSITAFSRQDLMERAEKLCKDYGHTVYIPHGAILGLDGIFDGRKLWKEVSIETRKHPRSLGRNDAVASVVYEGTTREACALFPRNVNVHAAVAMAGIGFDRTRSRIISDPAVNTNEHTIMVKGDGIKFKIHVSSVAGGAVSGAYTPYSACGSLKRVLGNGKSIRFV